MCAGVVVDGVVDSELRDPRVCEGVFDANSIRCTGENNATCLTEGEVRSLSYRSTLHLL